MAVETRLPNLFPKFQTLSGVLLKKSGNLFKKSDRTYFIRKAHDSFRIFCDLLSLLVAPHSVIKSWEDLFYCEAAGTFSRPWKLISIFYPWKLSSSFIYFFKKKI